MYRQGSRLIHTPLGRDMKTFLNEGEDAEVVIRLLRSVEEVNVVERRPDSLLLRIRDGVKESDWESVYVSVSYTPGVEQVAALQPDWMDASDAPAGWGSRKWRK